MEAEKDLLKLFHSHWFEQGFFTNKQASLNPIHQNLQNDEKPDLSFDPTLRIRSQSELCLSCKITFNPKLQTVLSGKELEGLGNSQGKGRERKRREKGRGGGVGGYGSRSLSELEFEELKGFMDLGFVFSEQDKDSRLVSIVPGLQRLGRDNRKNEEEHEECRVSRPYLSEVWGVTYQRKVNNPLMDWRNISSLPNKTDMKDHLRAWAQNVASSAK